jgi:hypothetical protein
LASPTGFEPVHDLKTKTRKKLKSRACLRICLAFFVCAESRILPKSPPKLKWISVISVLVLALSGNKKALENSNSQRPKGSMTSNPLAPNLRIRRAQPVCASRWLRLKINALARREFQSIPTRRPSQTEPLPPFAFLSARLRERSLTLFEMTHGLCSCHSEQSEESFSI